MKYGSSIVYKNWLIAPKGFVFNLESIKKSNVFCEESVGSLRTTLGGKRLKWEEYGVNISKDVSLSFWEECLTVENGCLVKQEK